MLQLKPIGLFSVFLFLVSCVTINVYFPAAAADSAAKTIVRDVLGDQRPEPDEPLPAEAEQGTRLNMDSVWASTVSAVMDLVISPANAKADIKIDTPVIRQLRQSLKKRHPQLQPHLSSGALGLTRDALVGIRDLSAVPLKERNRVKKWVADENRDRNALYKEIARANGHPEWEKDIRKTFARVWVSESQANIWYQDEKGRWKQKK
jgi:uncharacterized protein YdbL (DUF1318 family)